MQSRQDDAAMLAPAGEGEAPSPGADLHLIGDPRLALMVQHMTAFGRAVGENDWSQRDRGTAQRYEYFA